ncbi:MAG: ABC transporter ATP-binding protein [Candidatus Melainabacteria bacterium]|jgi:putative ABC transport system ATP-binding protein
MKTVISLKNINKSFGSKDALTQVLFDIDLSLHAEKMTFVTGPSGCGKTTLISIVAGILTPDNGEINILDINQNSLSNEEKALFRQQNLGFIFQQFNLVPTLTVAENVAVPLLIQGQDFDYAINMANVLLEKVGLKSKTEAFPKDLSGGQQQRVAIARALVNNPKILICDEPTASLDGSTGHSVMKLLKDISMNTERCVLVVTHDNRIYEYADMFVEMEDGRIKNVINN